ncbi:MAG: RNA polymerase sigma factor [Candidatus Eiseniibacteriota bacterium]
MRANPWGTDEALLARLRAGDDAAFAILVDDLHGRLVALATTFTSSPALAEDIVQETWLAVIRGLRAFEGRSLLRTWIFSILVRRARTIAGREARRGVPAAVHEGQNGDLVEWEPGRGRVGLWEETPVPWALEDPAAIHEGREALEVVRATLAELPVAQRQVVLLRDVEDVPARDVCNILDLSETNQRVLLHRGRARIRRALDRYVREGARERPGSTRTAPAATGAANETKPPVQRVGRAMRAEERP